MREVIRQVFGESGLSIRQLSLRAGIPYATAHGFVKGNADVTLRIASKMCRVLGLELRPARKRKGK